MAANLFGSNCRFTLHHRFLLPSDVPPQAPTRKNGRLTDEPEILSIFADISRNHGRAGPDLLSSAATAGGNNQEVADAPQSLLLGLREDSADTAPPAFAEERQYQQHSNTATAAKCRR